MARPQGPVCAALLDAAERAPGTVNDLAARAQVGFAVARYSVSRLVQRRELVIIESRRPAVLARPADGRVDTDTPTASLDKALGGWFR
jgi:hypothetical protein